MSKLRMLTIAAALLALPVLAEETPGIPGIHAMQSPSNAAWEALETDNPHSIDYASRSVSVSSESDTQWEMSETGSPDAAQPSNRAVAELSR